MYITITITVVIFTTL